MFEEVSTIPARRTHWRVIIRNATRDSRVWRSVVGDPKAGLLQRISYPIRGLAEHESQWQVQYETW